MSVPGEAAGSLPANPGETEVAAANDELRFRREYPAVWWLTLLGPFVLTGGLLFLIWQLAGSNVMWRVVSTALATFFLFGKFVILGGHDRELADVRRFFTAEQLVMLVLYMDAMTVSLLTFHLGFLFKLPIIGTKLKELVDDGQFILKSNPWMKRATFFGLVAFVLFPLAATGSVGGSIFGRLLGMSRSGTLIGIMLGNVMGSLLMYFGSGMITRCVGRDNPWLFVGGIVVFGAIVYVLNRRYRQLKKR